MSPRKDVNAEPQEEAELAPAKVGGPIDENAGKGDHTAHETMQSAETKERVAAEAEQRGKDAEANVAMSRKEGGLGPDGALDPNFEGTQPKLMRDGTLQVIGMQDLKQAAADKDGETVAEQERAAGLEVGQSLTPQAKEAEKQEELLEETEEEVEEVEDDGNMTVAELKEALDGAEIEYPSNARKADLLKLYNENFE